MMDGVRAERPSVRREDTAYFFGIRGISALVIMIFHCDMMVWYLPHRSVPAIYEALTSWLRYGDFRVVPFFVISGYLLTLPATKARDWPLGRGLGGFFKRRFTRVVFPYYFALAFSLVLFIAWRDYIGDPAHIKGHFPIYRLLLALVAARTDSVWIQGGLGLFVFTPICLAAAYAFHIRFERPFASAGAATFAVDVGPATPVEIGVAQPPDPPRARTPGPAVAGDGGVLSRAGLSKGLPPGV
jgi:peptidoglycan/LPS O-acetylase OafA/YrhL